MKKIVHIPPKAFSKYNQPEFTKITFTPDGLEALRKRHHEIRGVPGFIDDFLRLNPASGDLYYLSNRPELVTWSEDGTILLLPNYPKIDWDKMLKNPKKMKDCDGGFALTAWFIHPKQLEQTVFSNFRCRQDLSIALGYYDYAPSLEPKSRQKRDEYSKHIRDMETESGIPYLASVFDLTAAHLSWLKNMRKMTLCHLKATYGVSNKDHVELYFHRFIGEAHTTLHLQVKVNEGAHPNDEIDRMALDDIIEALERGKTIKELAIEMGAGYKVPSDYGDLDFNRGIQGIQHDQVIRPYCLNTRVVKVDSRKFYPELDCRLGLLSR